MNLADDLKSVDEANKILDKYEGHQKDKNHKSVMNAIVNANKKIFQEAKKMCEALLELMKDELDTREKAGIIRLIQTKLSKGKTVEAIAEDLEDSVENILALIKEMEKE